MLNFDFFSSLIVAILFAIAGHATIYRWRQTRDAVLWGLIISMFLLAFSYGVFTFNAYNELSNRPFRYWLRAFNAGLAVSVIWLSMTRYRQLKWELKRLREKVEQVQNGGRHE